MKNKLKIGNAKYTNVGDEKEENQKCSFDAKQIGAKCKKHGIMVSIRVRHRKIKWQIDVAAGLQEFCESEATLAYADLLASRECITPRYYLNLHG